MSLVARFCLHEFGYSFLVGVLLRSFCESFGCVSLVWGFGCTSLVALFWLRDFGGSFAAWLCEFGCVSLVRVSWLCEFWWWF